VHRGCWGNRLLALGGWMQRNNLELVLVWLIPVSWLLGSRGASGERGSFKRVPDTIPGRARPLQI